MLDVGSAIYVYVLIFCWAFLLMVYFAQLSPGSVRIFACFEMFSMYLPRDHHRDSLTHPIYSVVTKI